MLSKPRILTVEDEPRIADTLLYVLAADGFAPHWCASGEAALAHQCRRVAGAGHSGRACRT